MIKQTDPFRQIQLRTCPICGHNIDYAAKVDSDTPAQPSGAFWGPPGGRRRVCESGAFFHFVTTTENSGEEVHRLAYLMKRATGPGEPVKAAPEDGPVQLTLGGKILIEQR